MLVTPALPGSDSPSVETLWGHGCKMLPEHHEAGIDDPCIPACVSRRAGGPPEFLSQGTTPRESQGSREIQASLQ